MVAPQLARAQITSAFGSTILSTSWFNMVAGAPAIMFAEGRKKEMYYYLFISQRPSPDVLPNNICLHFIGPF